MVLVEPEMAFSFCPFFFQILVVGLECADSEVRR
jgi:hypothetical protein